MTLASSLAWTLLRAAVVGGLAAQLGRPIASSLRRNVGGRRWLLLAALSASWLMPSLIVGYAYTDFSLSLVRHPVLNELLYGLLLLLKLTPLAVGVWFLAPAPPLSPEALYCRQLVPRSSRRSVGSRRQAWAFAVRGPMRTQLLASGIVFLVVFSEFELAARFGAASWSVRLFDGQAGGLRLSHTLSAQALPVLIQLTALGLCAAALLSGRGEDRVTAQRPERRGAARAVTWLYVLVAVALVCVLPCAIVLHGTWEGLLMVVRQFRMQEELASSLVFASGGAAGALAVSYWLAGRRRVRPIAALIACLPGLLGALSLSLLLLACFQWPGLNWLYDTPLPLMLALVLLLMPLAVLLQIALGRGRAGSAMHLVEIMRGASAGPLRQAARRLRWQLRGRPVLFIGAVLFLWAYFDVAAAAILAPNAMPTATVRLHNLMHYGRIPGLSAMVAVMTLLPVAVVLLIHAVRVMGDRWVGGTRGERSAAPMELTDRA